MVFFKRKADAILDIRNGTYAHPDIGIFNARTVAPTIAPHKDICSMTIFMRSLINSSMKIKEAILQSMITHLLLLCKRELKLSELPKITLVEDDSTTDSGTSFGEFQNDTIQVVTKDRHPMDVARTLAHELVHWKQRISGLEMDGSDGSNTENDANAVAGVIMRKFGQMYPEYFVNAIP